MRRNKGILKTGDIAKKYKNNFYIIGRKKRFAKIYGHRINLDEVQKKLQDFSLKCICIEKNNLVYLSLISQVHNQHVFVLICMINWVYFYL